MTPTLVSCGSRVATHREQRRDLELENLEREKKLVRAEADVVAARISEAWAEWHRITDERQNLIEAAATEEIELRIDGKHAPWVYDALGPEPPAEQEGLAQRWYQAADHLARSRIDHDVTEPTDTGITNWDPMLVKKIRTLSQDSGQGLGMDD